MLIRSIVSEDVLENIFFKNSPLHDGAVIIADNKILAARCILPVSDNTNIPMEFGVETSCGDWNECRDRCSHHRGQ